MHVLVGIQVRSLLHSTYSRKLENGALGYILSMSVAKPFILHKKDVAKETKELFIWINKPKNSQREYFNLKINQLIIRNIYIFLWQYAYTVKVADITIYDENLKNRRKEKWWAALAAESRMHIHPKGVLLVTPEPTYLGFSPPLSCEDSHYLGQTNWGSQLEIARG